jgi:hypothetical protein
MCGSSLNKLSAQVNDANQLKSGYLARGYNPELPTRTLQLKAK